MEQKQDYAHFNGTAWFDRQVHSRTRAALTERGSTASTRSREYKTEYKRQMELFRTERDEIKQRRKEKYLARVNKRPDAERAEV